MHKKAEQKVTEALKRGAIFYNEQREIARQKLMGTLESASGMKNVPMTSLLESINSKRSAYAFITIKRITCLLRTFLVGFYMPPRKTISKSFLRDILRKKKIVNITLHKISVGIADDWARSFWGSTNNPFIRKVNIWRKLGKERSSIGFLSRQKRDIQVTSWIHLQCNVLFYH